jgi:FAD:protein FMN transferase
MKALNLLLAAGLLASAGCGRRGSQATYVQKTFALNVPAQFMAYGPVEPGMKELADELFRECERISSEFSFTDPFSQVSALNKRAQDDWHKAEPELFRLLELGLDYHRRTGGAFDITFAPLWPIWKEAASSRRMPAKPEIEAALRKIGSQHVKLDRASGAVRLENGVQVNIAGLLRPYAFERVWDILKERAPPYPVQFRLGGNTLVYGRRGWRYRVTDPFNRRRLLGQFRFEGGMVMSSSGRDVFVEIEGRRYSHILDLRTGYPLQDFSTLAIYFPDTGRGEFLSSAAVSVLGRKKAFEFLSGVKGAAAVWVDGDGKSHFLFNKDSAARWEEPNEILGGVLSN